MVMDQLATQIGMAVLLPKHRSTQFDKCGRASYHCLHAKLLLTVKGSLLGWSECWVGGESWCAMIWVVGGCGHVIPCCIFKILYSQKMSYYAVPIYLESSCSQANPLNNWNGNGPGNSSDSFPLLRQYLCVPWWIMFIELVYCHSTW